MIYDKQETLSIFSMFNDKSKHRKLHSLLRSKSIKEQYLYIKALKLVNILAYKEFVKVTMPSKQIFHDILAWYKTQDLDYSHPLKEGQPPIQEFVELAKQVIKVAP